MARPKNAEERRRIRDVAYKVFSEKGFENTSFSDIAKGASVTKSLVQYYYPKKEQFISDFINSSLSAVTQIVQTDLDYEFEHELGKLYAVGYAQFYFAMYNERMNSLRMDVLRERSNTELVANIAIDWILANTDAIPTGDEKGEENVRNMLIFIVGGAFDYLYNCMEHGISYDLNFLSDAAFALLSPLLPETFREGEHIRAAMTTAWLEKARKKYNRMLFLK